jgi:hypothetical protein
MQRGEAAELRDILKEKKMYKAAGELSGVVHSSDKDWGPSNKFFDVTNSYDGKAEEALRKARELALRK